MVKAVKAVEVVVEQYVCQDCDWPGRIKFPNDRLASGHAKSEGHVVEKVEVTRTNWTQIDATYEGGHV